jgi:hypothetical protein
MKYLKRYNEELTPTTPRNLRDAARKALKYQDEQRSKRFVDYSDTKEFGTYKMDIARSNSDQMFKDLDFTEVTIDNIVYGEPGHGISDTKDIYTDPNNPEKLIKEWEKGNDNLAITFDVCFKPTSETLKKIEYAFSITADQRTSKIIGSHFIDIEEGETPGELKSYKLNEKKLPLFRMTLRLANSLNYEYDYSIGDKSRDSATDVNCEYCQGSVVIPCENCDGEGEEWYNGGDDSRPCPDCNGVGEVTCHECDGNGRLKKFQKYNDSDIARVLYSGNEDEEGIAPEDKIKPNKRFILKMSEAKSYRNGTYFNYIGLFADKKSARKFQLDLPNAFSKSELKSKVLDLFSILGADSDDIENVINLFTNIPQSTIYSTTPINLSIGFLKYTLPLHNKVINEIK